MKAKIYFKYMAVILFFSAGCSQSEDAEPEICNIIVTTEDVTVLGNNSAQLTLYISGTTSQVYKSGLYYGTEPGLTGAKEIQYESNSSSHTVTLSSLAAGTKYYFKGYAEDDWGSRIESETDTFTTHNEPFSIVTGNYSQTDSQYKLYGFVGNNHQYYNYSYTFTLYATLTNAEDIDSWGIVWFDDYIKLGATGEEGTRSGSFGLLSKSAYGTHTYKAYAKLKDGSYRYGNVETLTYRHIKQ